MPDQKIDNLLNSDKKTLDESLAILNRQSRKIEDKVVNIFDNVDKYFKLITKVLNYATKSRIMSRRKEGGNHAKADNGAAGAGGGRVHLPALRALHRGRGQRAAGPHDLCAGQK